MIVKYDGTEHLLNVEDAFQAVLRKAFEGLFNTSFGLVELFLKWEASFEGANLGRLNSQQKALLHLAVEQCSNLRSLQLLLQFGYVNEAQKLLRGLIRGWLVFLKIATAGESVKKWLRKERGATAERIREKFSEETKSTYDSLCRQVDTSSKVALGYVFPPFASTAGLPGPQTPAVPLARRPGLPLRRELRISGYPAHVEFGYNSGPQGNFEAVEAILSYSSYVAADFLITLYEIFPGRKRKLTAWKEELDRLASEVYASGPEYADRMRQIDAAGGEIRKEKRG